MPAESTPPVPVPPFRRRRLCSRDRHEVIPRDVSRGVVIVLFLALLVLGVLGCLVAIHVLQ